MDFCYQKSMFFFNSMLKDYYLVMIYLKKVKFVFHFSVNFGTFCWDCFAEVILLTLFRMSLFGAAHE